MTGVQTPVALIIFNRPHTTERVLARIAEARPRQLFVIADGPRADHPGDSERCAAARAVVDRVDWDCRVIRNYSDVNLGCGRRPASGIDWVFEQVDRAIILEDDCVPHLSFFRFCEELLERYRDDERVMQISGNNFQLGRRRTRYSYFFSCHNICWGWASWRRAWRYHDMALGLWPALRDTPWLLDIVGDPRAARVWRRMFDIAHARGGDVDFWDYQWTFACWAQHGLSILPNATLVSNVGFGDDATHTKGRDKRAHLPTSETIFPLEHPPYVARDAEADRFIVEEVVLPGLPEESGLLGKLRRVASVIASGPVRRPESMRDVADVVARGLIALRFNYVIDAVLKYAPEGIRAWVEAQKAKAKRRMASQPRL